MLTRFIIVLSFFFMVNSYGSQSVEQYLAKQSNIRVNMSGGPGFGDQSNTYNVMNHLREMGFNGTFDVVYDRKIRDKLITLFDLPSNLPDVYEDKTKKLSVIEVESYFQRLKDGLISQDEWIFSVGKGPNPLDEFNETNAKADVNFSSYYDSRGGRYSKTYISLLKDKNYSDRQFNSGSKFFVFPIYSYDDAREYLVNDPKGQALLENKPGLLPFLKGLDAKQFNVMFLYGKTLQFSDGVENSFDNRSPSNILQVIAGARYAQLHGGPDLSKPLIIAVFYDYQVESKQLLQLVDNDQWGKYEQPGADLARQAFKELQLSSALTIANITEARSIDQIKHLQANQIMLLSMEPFPKIVFDGLYQHTADNVLPQVYEGAATFSALNLSGRPRFECADTSSHGDVYPDSDEPSWTLGYDQLTDNALKTRMKLFYSSTLGFCGSKRNGEFQNYMEPWRYKIHESLGQFIIEAMDTNSSFSHYFRDIKKYVLNPGSDRVRYALQEVISQSDR